MIARMIAYSAADAPAVQRSTLNTFFMGQPLRAKGTTLSRKCQFNELGEHSRSFQNDTCLSATDEGMEVLRIRRAVVPGAA